MNAIFSAEDVEHGTQPDCERSPNEGTQHAHVQREQFAFSYLPRKVADIFEETLRCYTADLFNAFALMCRRTVTASQVALHDTDGQHSRDAVEEILRIGQVDDNTAATLEAVLFADEPDIPNIDAAVAGVLLEVLKDVLYQSHVRAARFAAAMKVRRFFAEEHHALTGERRRRGG
jgi:hypothetical protein